MSATDSQPNSKFSAWHALKRYLPRLLLTILIDVIIPLGLLFVIQNYIKILYALIIAGIPPCLTVIVKVIRYRTFDALGFIICIGFIMSAIVGVTTQDPYLLLLGQSLVTAVMCLIYSVTLIPFERCHPSLKLRPLFFYFYQDLAPTTREQLGVPDNIFEDQTLISDKQEVAKVYDWLYGNFSSFRRYCLLVTFTWSIGLLIGFLAQLILILVRVPVNTIAIYGHVALTSVMIICIVLTVILVAKERKQTMKQIETWKTEHLSMQQ